MVKATDDNNLPCCVSVNHTYVKPTKFTCQIQSKLSHKLTLQWDRLILKQGVLHPLYIFNEIEYHQLVLPQQYH